MKMIARAGSGRPVPCPVVFAFRAFTNQLFYGYTFYRLFHKIGTKDSFRCIFRKSRVSFSVIPG